MTKLDPQTIDAVKAAVDESTQKAIARRAGVSQGTISHIMHERHEHVSLETENKVRAALGLSQLAAKIAVDPCPDCGGSHHGRCHNKSVILRPVSQRRYATIHAMPTRELARVIRERVEV